MDILIADDNEATRLVARAILEREGHTISLARSGEDALALMRVREFGAVLLDILMPGMDGIRTLGGILEIAPQVTVFALTSHDAPPDVARYMASGFDGVIGKPLQPGDFARALHICDTGAPAILSKSGPVAPDTQSLPLLDLEVITDGVGRTGPSAAAVVLAHYRRSLAAQVSTLRQTLSGALALDPTDLRAFRDALHGLRSASATIGLSRAPAIASAMRNAPPDVLREGVADLIVAIRESLPALEVALGLAPEREPGALVALGQRRAAVKVSGQHQTEAAHHHQHDRTAIAHQR